MGHNPIPPRRPHYQSRAYVERERLALLREKVACGELDYATHGRMVEQVLRGEEPTDDAGLPVIPDPGLR